MNRNNLLIKKALLLVSTGFVFLAGCTNGDENSSQLQSATMALRTAGSSLYPVAGQYIDSSVAHKYILNYSKSINANGASTRSVLFRTDSLIKALQGYQRSGGEYTRVYFGVDSLGFEVDSVKYSRLTVFFQAAKDNGSREIDDIPFYRDSLLTRPYNLGIICPPPKCGGRSNFYPSL